MHNDFSDITSRIAEAPSWFDTNGVPRYGDFTPKALPDIYCDECALVEIACQDCEKRYKVAFSSSKLERLTPRLRIEADITTIDPRPIATAIRSHSLGYGDPPNCLHKPGCAGPTMTSDPVRVLEYWSRNDQAYVDRDKGIIHDAEAYFTWKRDPSLEISIADDDHDVA